MSISDRLRSRLALRFYVVGLLQLAAIVGGFFVFGRLLRAELASRHEREDVFAETLVDGLHDPAALEGQLEDARRELEVLVRVVDPDGIVVASTVPRDAPPCRPHRRPGRGRGHRGRVRRHRPPDGVSAPPAPAGPPPATLEGPPAAGRPSPRGPWQVCRVTLLPAPAGGVVRVEFRPVDVGPPPSPFGLPVLAFVLVVVGVASWLLARSVTRPLARMSAAAEALGAGDLDARSGLDRRDEIGAVAASFDAMADRVRDLLQTERELVASVSHELRTPLARIRVALDLAAEGDVELARESLQDIADDVDELEHLVSDLLVAARLEGGASGGVPALRRESIEAASFTADLAEGFAERHPDRVLRAAVGDTLPVLEADPVLLRRVVDNLLDNAVKYADADPIELSVDHEGATWTLAVRDEGIGIDEADQARIFEPFYRVDRSRTRATGGHGLGLALARRIVEAHGGRIEVKSALGEGTTMTVHLPVDGT